MITLNLIAGVLGLSIIATWETNLKPSVDEDTRKYLRLGRYLSIGMVSYGIVVALVLPLFRMKCAPYIEHFGSGVATSRMEMSFREYKDRKLGTAIQGVP